MNTKLFLSRLVGSDLYRGVKQVRALLPLLLLASACTTEDDLDTTSQNSGAWIDGTGVVRWPGVTPIYYYIDVYGHHADSSQPACSFATNVGLSTADSNSDGEIDVVTTIHKGLARYELETPLRFEELTHAPTWSDHLPVLIFTSGSKPYNYGNGTPGRTNGGVVTSSDYQGCVLLLDGIGAATIEHEVGHDIGLIHEQARSDRDSYVDIDPATGGCIAASDYSNFSKIDPSTNLTPYDYHSIMHYDIWSLCDLTNDSCVTTPSCNNDGDTSDCVCNHPTILKAGCTNHVTGATDPNCTDVDGDEIGSLGGFSPDDINQLYRMYEPNVGIDETNDGFGTAMVAGDFDGDGYDDLAVGTPNEGIGSGALGGAVQLFKGTEGGLVQWKYLYQGDFGYSAVAGDKFGAALAAGDYDSDGDAELFVGAPGYNGGHGAVFRYNGQNQLNARGGVKAGTVYTDPSPSTGTNGFGSAIAVGKYDGTNMAFVVGAPNAAKCTVRSGLAFVHPAGTSATTWTTLSPDNCGSAVYASGTRFGAALAVSANLTGAGSGGLVVGAPGASNFSGRVFVYNAALSTTVVKTANNPANGDNFGAALDIGHYMLNSPGRDYLSIGAPYSGTGGKVTVWEVGSTALTLKTTLTQSDVGMTANTGDRFGAALAHGDIDLAFGDDLVVGIPGNNSSKGAIALFHANGSLTVPLAGWTNRYEQDDGWTRQAGDLFGSSVAVGRFGDVDGELTVVNDYAYDLAAGQPGRAPGGVTGSGSFQWWFGRGGGSEPTFAAGFDENIATPE